MKYPELVLKEAEALKKHATEEEKNRLDFDYFVPDDDSRCIYGLMTGTCHSDRAISLIKLSCERVYNRGGRIPNRIRESDLNGTPLGKDREEYWSPIEVFIAAERVNQDELNYKLIQFIKGEIKSL